MAWKITSIGQATTLDRLGNFVRIRIVNYMVDDQGPFQVEIPVEEFTAAKVRETVTSQAREIEELLRG